MSHDAMQHLPRVMRRKLIADERRLRHSADWGPWEEIHLPNGVPGTNGWPREVRMACKNRVFSVLMRPVDGKVVHLAVTSLSQQRPTWWEMQRIKSELAGLSATGVEVYPPDDQIVDDAHMYHLWILPESLPFILKGKP